MVPAVGIEPTGYTGSYPAAYADSATPADFSLAPRTGVEPVIPDRQSGVIA
jgi:hypothetical protein